MGGLCVEICHFQQVVEDGGDVIWLEFPGGYSSRKRRLSDAGVAHQDAFDACGALVPELALQPPEPPYVHWPCPDVNATLNVRPPAPTLH
ncbi:hypothetical protein MAR_000468 [Mya arenaria]|uniref:Uncharacterized protein n=1 Tax=Mya arenaria TaxID=6604 RepID=A0ABY7F932_MYAAR|nr:hypothetical protein MAR_000468 [Mya arenaria]